MTTETSIKIFILANTAARTLDFASLEAACQRLARHTHIELIRTSTPEEASQITSRLSEIPGNIVAAAGGDGTINTLLNAMSPHGTLGIIPAGTANVIARELGIPLAAGEAAKVLVTGALQPVDTALCNDRKFLFVAGFGFDAEVAGSVGGWRKKLLGRAAYHLAGLQSFINYQPPHLEVECDGVICQGHYVIIANMRRYGGELFFAPSARYDDGLLDLVILKKFSPGSLLRLLNFARGNGRFPDDVAETRQGRHFVITADRPTPYQLDGEVFAAANRFTVTLAAQTTRMITP
jgi:diacylglycerol kinase (ATP)